MQEGVNDYSCESSLYGYFRNWQCVVEKDRFEKLFLVVPSPNCCVPAIVCNGLYQKLLVQQKWAKN